MDVERRFWQQHLYLTSQSLLVSLGELMTDLLVVRASPSGCNRCPSKSSACIHFTPLFAPSFGQQKCGSKNIQRAMHSRCESGWNKQFQRLLSSSSGFRDEENFLALFWGCRSKREQLQNKFGNSQYLLNSIRLPVTTLSAFSASVSFTPQCHSERERYYPSFHYVCKTNRLGVLGQPPIFRCLGTRILLITVNHSSHYMFLHWYHVTLTWD